MTTGIDIGWNLGNALESVGSETAWRNPRTTREMVSTVAARGFTVFRCPVTWTSHLGPAPEYTIDPAWIERVREVITWAREDGMRVILNTHHDNGLFQPIFRNMPTALAAFTAVWRQLAEALKDVDENLILEAMNEPRPSDVPEEWQGGTRESRQCINVLQHAFVQIVRASGGFNATRPLIVTVNGATITPVSFQDLILPKDDRLILALHCYEPARFCHKRPGTNPTPIFDRWQEAAVESIFEVIQTYAVPLGVPIWITEFGSQTKVDDEGRHNDAEVAKYARCFVGHAREKHIPCIWWDNNYFEAGDEWFALLDRERLTWQVPQTVNALMEAAKE